MKKITILILFSTVLGYSQVGVSTTNPDATLDVVATNPTGAATTTDGILIPRVDRQRAQVMTGTITSTMVFVNSIATGAAAGTAINITSTGFYYYDGTVWQKIATGASTDWALSGNAGTTAGTNFIGTTDAIDFRIKTAGTDRWNISNANSGQLQSYSLGTAALPSYSFQTDTNTGLFSSGADALDFSTAGTARFRVPNANQVHALSLGTATLPFYSFSGQTGTGLFGVATDVLGFSTAGTEKARFLSTGQMGIGTTTPQGVLDITSTTNGVLVPRVSLAAINVAAPIVNPQGGGLVSGTLVWNTATAGAFPNNVIPGFYYWNGTIWISVTGAAANAWSLVGNGGTNGGNTLTAGTNFLGTTDAQNIDFRTSNIFRGRFSSLGEFFVGTLNTSLPGDLMNGVGNTTFPWAINGYTSFGAGGVYGLRQAGSTGTWGAVQGELDASLPAASRGVSGTGSVNSHYGVYGSKPAGGTGFGGLFLNDFGYSGGFFNVSDERLKKNIKPLFNGLDKISQLKFYTYNFKADEYDVVGGNELHYGVMANELEQILPSLVKLKVINAGKTRHLSEDKQIKSIPFEVKMVNYLELIPIAIQAIKEQQIIIQSQNERLERLEKLVDKLTKN